MNALPLIGKNRTNSSHFSEHWNSQGTNEPDHGAEHAEREHGAEWAELVRIAFVALAAATVWFHVWEPFPHISVIGNAATLTGGSPIFKEAFENIVERKMAMELSMTIALVSARILDAFLFRFPSEATDQLG
jgi:cation transport ATPase